MKMKTVSRENAENYVNATIAAMREKGINTPHHLGFMSVAAMLDEKDMTEDELAHVKAYGRQPLASCEPPKPMAPVVPEGSQEPAKQPANKQRGRPKARL